MSDVSLSIFLSESKCWSEAFPAIIFSCLCSLQCNLLQQISSEGLRFEDDARSKNAFCPSSDPKGTNCSTHVLQNTIRCYTGKPRTPHTHHRLGYKCPILSFSEATTSSQFSKICFWPKICIYTEGILIQRMQSVENHDDFSMNISSAHLSPSKIQLTHSHEGGHSNNSSPLFLA